MIFNDKMGIYLVIENILIDFLLNYTNKDGKDNIFK